MSTIRQYAASIFPAFISAPKKAERRPLSTLSQKTAGRLRRSTLVVFRWMAISGQGLALIFVAFVLGYSLPILPCVVIIGLSALANLILANALPMDRRVSDIEAGVQLGFDVLQLAALLWLTGGMTNPFALLFLAPVVTSATTLSRPVLLILGLMTAILSFSLLYNSAPLPWNPAGSFTLPFLYTLGMWVALMIGTAFTSLYAWRAAKQSRRMSEALAATEAVLAQEQKLAALGSLAAAAAHELGTPLATIQLTASEMAREVEPGSFMSEDVDLLVSQSQRCRDILQQLAVRGDEGDIILDSLTLKSLLEEAASPFYGQSPRIDLDVTEDELALTIERQAELLYGLKNFIENAVDFAESDVTLKGRWTDSSLKIDILDDGPGFAAAVIDKLGEPYVSGRDDRSKAGGLGLGVFIAKTLIERTGGSVKFKNQKRGGAAVYLEWPKDVLVQHNIDLM